MTEEPRADRPPNSMKSKQARKGTPGPGEPKPVVEKIIDGNVVERKKSIFAKIASAFAPDEKESITDSILMDVLVPAAKNMMYDSVSEFSDAILMGFQRAIFGDRLPRSRYDRPSGYTTTGAGYINYSKPARVQTTREYGTISSRGRASHDFKEIVFPTRGDAIDVLDGLQGLIVDYGIATVEDFYRMTGISPDFPDGKYGWEDLRGAAVRHTRGGYMIALPRPRPID